MLTTMADRVVLYSRAGCHLCVDAEQVVAEVCAELGEPFTEVDIDKDPALKARYRDEVPVVTVDGEMVGFWRIDAARLRAALTP